MPTPRMKKENKPQASCRNKSTQSDQDPFCFCTPFSPTCFAGVWCWHLFMFLSLQFSVTAPQIGLLHHNLYGIMVATFLMGDRPNAPAGFYPPPPFSRHSCVTQHSFGRVCVKCLSAFWRSTVFQCVYTMCGHTKRKSFFLIRLFAQVYVYLKLLLFQCCEADRAVSEGKQFAENSVPSAGNDLENPGIFR